MAIADAPLAALRVLDLGAGDPGAVARVLLADAGADVRVVEERDALSPWERGSRRIGVSDARTLLAGTAGLDCVLAGSELPAGVTDRTVDRAPSAPFLDELRRRRPDLVTGLVTAYGTRGPLAGRAGDGELLVAARAGLASMQAGWDPGPSAFAVPVIATNAGLLLAAGVLGALVGRFRTGRGDGVETSLMAGALATLTEWLVDGPGIDMGARMRLLARRPNGVQPFYGAYRCADGRWVHLGASYPRFAQRAATALGLDRTAPDVIAGPGFEAGLIPSERTRDALYPLIEAAVATRPLADWLAVLEAADVPVAPVLSPDEFLDDPQARANGVLTYRNAGRCIQQYGSVLRYGPMAGVAADASGAPRAPAAAEATPLGDGPLEGIRVLELGNLIAAPLAARVLADLGATVTKLESVAGGDLTRSNSVPAFHPLNAGKRAIAVDLKHPQGRAIGHALAAASDVVLANMRPGAMERLGLGPEELFARNCSLVVCNASAFGATGPRAHRPGVDGLAAAIAGTQVIQGGGSGRPVQLTAATTDHATGLLAAVGILTALVGRERAGGGRAVGTSLVDAAALMTGPYLVRIDGRPRACPRSSQYGESALRRLYATADGWIALDANGSEVALRRIVGDPPLARRLAGRPSATWLARFEQAGVPAAPVVEEPWTSFTRDEQLVALDAIATVVGRDGREHRFTQGWIRSVSEPTIGQVRGPAPALGADTHAILEELGYAGPDRRALIADGVVVAAATREPPVVAP